MGRAQSVRETTPATLEKLNPERSRKIEQLYHAVLGREPAERAAFLAHACGSDDQLRRQVESLLAERSGLSDTPLPEGIATAATSRLAPGTELGPYRIEDFIGKGGMGEVWRARDTRVNRVIAIKMSHSRFDDRFAREARAIAALNHPNLCSLYDVGPSFLVLEYVTGKPVGPMHDPAKLIDIAV